MRFQLVLLLTRRILGSPYYYTGKRFTYSALPTSYGSCENQVRLSISKALQVERQHSKLGSRVSLVQGQVTQISVRLYTL